MAGGEATGSFGSAGSVAGNNYMEMGRNVTLSAAEIAYIAKTYWNAPLSDDVVIAVAVAMAESGGRTGAHNPKPPDDSYGLWQINFYGPLRAVRLAAYGITTPEALYDPYRNAEAAWKVYHAAGNSFRPWSTYTNGAYKKHMSAAAEGVKNPKQPSGVGINPDGPNQTKTKSALADLFAPIFDFISEGLLRVAGFVGGALLILIALVMLMKRTTLGTAAKTLKAVTK